MWCNLCGAIYVVQAMWCSFMWVQYMWCTLCGKIEKEWIWDATLSGIRSASQTWRISFAKVTNSGPQGPPVGPPSGGSRIRQFRGSAPRRKRGGSFLQKWPVRAPRGLPWAPAQPGGRECDRVGYARGRSGGNRRQALGDPEPAGANGGAAPLRIILKEGWPGRPWAATLAFF